MEPSESFFNDILSGGASQRTLLLVLSMMKKEGRLDRVIEECSKALEIYPDDIRIRKLLAEACYEAGRISEAESEIETATVKIKELMSCYRFLADIYMARGKTTEAVEALKLYVIHRPDDTESYALLESMLPKEEILSEFMPGIQALSQEPEEESAEAIVSLPLNAEFPDIATPTLAEVYYDQGKIMDAIDTYEKVLERHPEDSGSRFRLDELKIIQDQARAMEIKRQSMLMGKKKMASILEKWLAGVREQKEAGLSVR
jgi:tetratricopeptide (TPR) repeat protein